MFSVDWVQHAVGHGGFHVGQARANDRTTFDWVFDCGARRTERFNDFLKTWTAERSQPIDWLFISHFDTDHVSGLDTLMSRTVVRDVMVPYVNERELAFLLLYEIGRNNLDRWFFELVADPAVFFLARGADRVTFLRGRGPDSAPEEPGPHGDSPKDQQGWFTKFHPEPQPLREPSLARASRVAGARIQQIQGGECDIDVVRGSVGLRLKPYRAPIQSRLLRGLTKRLQNMVGAYSWLRMRPGLGDLAYAVAHHARTAKGRAELRSIFKDYVGSSNRASLSLLSMSHTPQADQEYWQLENLFMSSSGRGAAAWLTTGDAELLAPADLADWRRCYQGYLPYVRVLSLPHHGSDKNSDAALQALCPGAPLVAHVKADAKKHPGMEVAYRAGNRLACVTELPGTEMRMWFHAY